LHAGLWRGLRGADADRVHVLGRDPGWLVTHTLWVTRWLQAGVSSPLRTAAVAAVARDQDCRCRGYATQLMRRIPAEIQDFQLAVLSPFDTAWYARLGWELWRGPPVHPYRRRADADARRRGHDPALAAHTTLGSRRAAVPQSGARARCGKACLGKACGSRSAVQRPYAVCGVMAKSSRARWRGSTPHCQTARICTSSNAIIMPITPGSP